MSVPVKVFTGRQWMTAQQTRCIAARHSPLKPAHACAVAHPKAHRRGAQEERRILGSVPALRAHACCQGRATRGLCDSRSWSIHTLVWSASCMREACTACAAALGPCSGPGRAARSDAALVLENRLTTEARSEHSSRLICGPRPGQPRAAPRPSCQHRSRGSLGVRLACRAVRVSSGRLRHCHTVEALRAAHDIWLAVQRAVAEGWLGFTFSHKDSADRIEEQLDASKLRSSCGTRHCPLSHRH